MGHGGRGNFYSHNKFGENLMDLDADASSSGSSFSSEDIVHFVSKLDTLAGIAIKYGVEVADIKKLNGLTTDLQMFARKSLRIPSSGKHPPSEHASVAGPSNADPQPRLGIHSFPDISGSLRAARTETKLRERAGTGLLRGYHGLSDPKEGTEMQVYKEEAGYRSDEESLIRRDEDELYPRSRPKSAEPKLSLVSMAKDFVASEVEKARDRMAVRRRPKGEFEDGLKQEVATPVKNPVPRPRKLGVEVEVDYPPVRAAVVFNTGSRFSEVSGGGGRRKVMEEVVFKLKKSSSTPNFQEETPNTSKTSDLSTILNNSSSSSNSSSNSSITIPLLDTFTRRNKAALD